MKRAISIFILMSLYYNFSLADEKIKSILKNHSDSFLSAKKIFYITRLTTPKNATKRHIKLQRDGLNSDKRVKLHLEHRGFKVTMADQYDSMEKAKGHDLIILSSVVQSREMSNTLFKNSKIPLLTWENDLFDSLRLTGRKKGIHYGEKNKEHYIRIINAPHPLSAGLSAGKTYVYPRDVMMGWGVPSRAAIVIATLPGELDKAVIFAYEKGSTMDYDFLAPARRVALFLDNYTFEKLTPTGLKLFDAAVDWSISKPK